MIPRIKELKTRNEYQLYVLFDDGRCVIYDVKEDIKSIPSYQVLMQEPGLFECVKLDESRTCVYWNDEIDLPSDVIYEYGKIFER